MRYIIHDGFISSKNDGDRHFISCHEVARLYGLNPNGKNVVLVQSSNPEKHKGAIFYKDDIDLYPRYDGNYKLT